MTKETIEKYTRFLTDVKNSGKSIKKYCVENGVNVNSLFVMFSKLKKNKNKSIEELDLVNLYNDVATKFDTRRDCDENLDKDSVETNIVRVDNIIDRYEYTITRKNGQTINGSFSRGEMESIYRMYTAYGDGLTQRIVSREFPDIMFSDFRKLLRAFDITKNSAPFPLHMIEELPQEELLELQNQQKEAGILKRIEQDRYKNTDKLNKKLVEQNAELKKFNSITVNITGKIPAYKPIKVDANNNNGLVLYLADLHMGARVLNTDVYDENKNWGLEEAKRRLEYVLNQIPAFGQLKFIKLILLGDMLDCCGIDGMTARQDHLMPYSMTADEQADAFCELMAWFVPALSNYCENLEMWSVFGGNHDGSFGNQVTKRCLAEIKNHYPQLGGDVWNPGYGELEINGHYLLFTHGKENRFDKKAMPLNLTPDVKVKIYEYLMKRGIINNKVHIIKGDLHTHAYSSCERFDYLNTLSLFGASDYANNNYSRNAYGMNYDLFIGEHIVRGAFTNM